MTFSRHSGGATKCRFLRFWSTIIHIYSHHWIIEIAQLHLAVSKSGPLWAVHCKVCTFVPCSCPVHGLTPGVCMAQMELYQPWHLRPNGAKPSETPSWFGSPLSRSQLVPLVPFLFWTTNPFVMEPINVIPDSEWSWWSKSFHRITCISRFGRSSIITGQAQQNCQRRFSSLSHIQDLCTYLMILRHLTVQVTAPAAPLQHTVAGIRHKLGKTVKTEPSGNVPLQTPSRFASAEASRLPQGSPRGTFWRLSEASKSLALLTRQEQFPVYWLLTPVSDSKEPSLLT